MFAATWTPEDELETSSLCMDTEGSIFFSRHSSWKTEPFAYLRLLRWDHRAQGISATFIAGQPTTGAAFFEGTLLALISAGAPKGHQPFFRVPYRGHGWVGAHLRRFAAAAAALLPALRQGAPQRGRDARRVRERPMNQ